MALRVRVAASACLVASGLFIGGAGGAIALADPGHGYQDTDDQKANDSTGNAIRDALGNRDKPVQTRSHPRGPWHTGRPWKPGEQEPPPKGGDPPPTEDPPPKEDPPTEDPPPKDPCEGDPGPGNPPPAENPPQSSGGGGAIEQLPRFKPPNVPDMQLPNELNPGVPGGPAVLDAGAGAAAAPVGPPAPIALPVIVAPPIGLGAGAGGGAPGGPPPAAPPASMKGFIAEPPAGRITPPAGFGANSAAPAATYRVGYAEYLRTAGLPQVAALAVPGLAGILVLTGAGGLVGYRQAKAGTAVRAGSARFMR